MNVVRDVYYVENLNNSGKGSLRDALEPTSGHREIRFAVGGTSWIDDPIVISNSGVDILADTAPGKGFCLAGSYMQIKTHNVAVQGLRCRPEPGAYKYGLLISNPAHGITIDRSSFSFSSQINLDIYNAYDVLVQRCIIADSTNYRYGSLSAYGSNNVRFINNLFYGNAQRNPLITCGRQLVKNNVICISGDIGTQLKSQDGEIRADYIGNYFRQPSATYVKNIISREGLNDPSIYVHSTGNVYEQFPDVTQGGMFRVVYEPDFGEYKNGEISRLNYGRNLTAQQAFDYVLANAGARPLDTLDAAIIADVTAGGSGRLIDDPSEVGGWPELSERKMT